MTSGTSDRAATPTLTVFQGADQPDDAGLRACVHCGICLPQCPTYRVLGEEMDSPRGRIYLIRAVAEGRLGLTEGVVRHLDLCLGCRACETACPAGVPFGSLLEATRAQIQRAAPQAGGRWFTRLVLGVFAHPVRASIAFKLLRLYRGTGLQRLVRATGLLGHWPRLGAMESLVADVPAPIPLPALIPAVGPCRGRAGLLLGCVQRHLFPGVNRDTARLLSLAGYDVVVPPVQGCCGALDLHAGRLDVFRARVQDLARVFADVDLVVVNAAGCGSALKEAHHWADQPEVARLADRTRDVAETLIDADLPLGPLALTVAYQDACHLAHGQRVRREPRELLSRIPGLELVELRDVELCCGSAGIYNLQEPAMAERLLELKLGRIAETGAPVVTAGNPGCLLQIAKGARARGLPLEVVHPVELLARAVEPPATARRRRGER
jgi:glycolate oxidase iron-sulfur subunit